MFLAIPFIQATIIVGYASEGCGPWAESQQKAQLSDFMGKMWRRLAARLGKVEGRRDEDLERIPLPHEARKVTISPTS